VSLTGSVGTSALRAGDLAKYSSVSWSVGPSVTVPVFDAGKRQATVRIAEAQRDQAFATFHSTLLTALEDVENALVSLSRERVARGDQAHGGGEELSGGRTAVAIAVRKPAARASSTCWTPSVRSIRPKTR